MFVSGDEGSWVFDEEILKGFREGEKNGGKLSSRRIRLSQWGLDDICRVKARLEYTEQLKIEIVSLIQWIFYF